jgi:UDP-N-acetylmuramoyl-L-alanyl-D-glutamate--2,6-diaminopimelate ligase
MKILRSIVQRVKKLIPKPLIQLYHYSLAFCGALIYLFPSKQLFVIGVTGTKGKTTTVELINAILEANGETTALAGTLRFKIAKKSKRNKYKMTMPGRFFMQRFLRQAVNAGCRYAILEMTSEGVKQFRHKFIALDALVFTNLAPEHIESHGSYERYRQAKLSIAKHLALSPKPKRIMVANIDDKEGRAFLEEDADEKYGYSLSDAAPYAIEKSGLRFVFNGVNMDSRLVGIFNLYNILAAATFAKSQNIPNEIIRSSLASFTNVPGRVEKVNAGQDFAVIVDYAHTPDSLRNVYAFFKEANSPPSKLICVLGSTGGGRDKWKRPEMGRIADEYCDSIILTNEDPYDENPRTIIENIAQGIAKTPFSLILDRRAAIRQACEQAQGGDTVLITGKGTDPYIMGPHGSKVPWDDASVAREELLKITNNSKN